MAITNCYSIAKSNISYTNKYNWTYKYWEKYPSGQQFAILNLYIWSLKRAFEGSINIICIVSNCQAVSPRKWTKEGSRRVCTCANAVSRHINMIKNICSSCVQHNLKASLPTPKEKMFWFRRKCQVSSLTLTKAGSINYYGHEPFCVVTLAAC